MLLNETKGPLQQHLQLQAGNITTKAQIRSINSIIHQATSNHIRQQQPRTGTDGHRSNMVQQRKRKEGQAQGQRKYNKGTGYGNYSHNNYKGGKGKYNQQPVGQGNPLKAWIWQRKRIQQQRERQRILQQPTRRKRSKRKTSNNCLLQMWTTRTHGQTMQSGDLQL